MSAPVTPAPDARFWHGPMGQWVKVLHATSTPELPLGSDEVVVTIMNLPGSEAVVKVASLREQP